MHTMNRTVVVLAGGLFSLLLFSDQATACCAPAPVGKPVAFGDQSNIIIWNAETKTEHFIRKANFKSVAKDFGFIAPTPSKPELSEASEEAFQTLADLGPRKKSGSIGNHSWGMTAMSIAPVVVQEKDVAGYHATTLLAHDAAGLAAWLKNNGYVSTPATKKWTQVYIDKGWYLTAFKVKNPKQAASTGTIRMSFKTEQAFNPFYVPTDNIVAGKKGTLKVFFVAEGNYEATVGHHNRWKSQSWQAPLSAGPRQTLAEQVKLSPTDIPKKATVEMFADADFPRAAADDIYFSLTK